MFNRIRKQTCYVQTEASLKAAYDKNLQLRRNISKIKSKTMMNGMAKLIRDEELKYHFEQQ